MKFAFKYKWLIGTLFIWAIIFVVPSLRYHLQVMTKGSPWIHLTVLPNHYDQSYNFPNIPNLPLPIKVRQAQNSNQDIGLSTTMDALPEVDKLISQNPNLSWLIAMHLQIALGAYNGNRQGGELSEVDISDDIKKGIPSVEKDSRKVNFTPKQLKETLVLCRRGEKLEPQNAYFSWMRFYFLMLSWQDEKARTALREAASKSYWNNHEAEYDRLFVKAASDILNRQLTPYEIDSFDSLHFDFNASSRTREMGRIIGWEDVKLKRSGKHNEALELSADEYHAMTLATQGASHIIPFLVSSAMLSIAAKGATYPSRESFRDGRPKKRSEEQRMQSLFAYAKKYHRPDLAQQLERDWQKNHALMQKKKTSDQIDQSYFESSLMQAAAILLALSVLIILSILGALLTWIFLECYRMFARGKNTFDEEPFTNLWNRCKGVIACSGFPSFLLGILFLAGLVSVLSIFIPQNAGYSAISGWIFPDYANFPYDPTIIGHIFAIFRNPTEMYSSPFWWRLYALLTPLITGSSFVLLRGSQNSTRKHSVWRTLGKGFYLALLLIAWGIPALTSEYNLPQVVLTTICIAFLLISLIWMWWKSRKRADFKLSLMQSSLSGWILVGSILVLALLIGQSALDKRFQPWANIDLRGQMHLLHHVADSPP